ncbi:MAG: glycosyltransferase family 4 protein [Rhodospirillales bacterium]|nr:glycosyltransferase family 4 protein [Rhodospirillales bacterium]
MTWTTHVAVFVMVHVAAFAGTGLAFMLLSWLSLFDHPNERSSHSGPIPRGAGLVVTPVLVAAVGGIGFYGPNAPASAIAVAGLALVLGFVSWRDDRHGLPIPVRLVAQAGAIAAALYVMRDAGPFLGGVLPPWLDLAVAGLFWLWFTNLFNFMDGIDGVAATETVLVGFGAAIVAALAFAPGGLSLIGVSFAAAATGFLWWNWPPAKIFLGDVGSIPLGFLLGWLLLLLAQEGQWAAALILPLYYLADATLTLAGRILRRERFWQAHRQHFYQRAARGRMGHAGVTLAVLAAGVVLIAAAAAAALGFTPWALAAAGLVVALLLYRLSRAARSW